MTENLIGIIGVLGFGIGAQWLAWRLRSPAILFLLLFGFIAGPITGIVKPDQLFGNSFHPFISLAVSIILFEGGMTLRFSELKRIGNPVRNLVTLGVLITWILGTWASYKILGLSFSLACVLGAILVVTGPTVIMPMLRQLRLSSNLASTLKWEAMINDPTGILLAVLVFEVVLAGSFQESAVVVVSIILKTVFLGAVLGVFAGLLVAFLIRKHWVPDYLQNVVTLALVTTTAGFANILQPESGLFAATIMGIVLANQKKVSVQRIMEFKENLRVLLISVLFIILAARMKMESLSTVNVSTLTFFVFMVIIARPVAVFLSTLGSELSWREKCFLSWMAPRGIVAAAAASIFALSLEVAGYPEAEKLLTLTFLMIIGTVLLYGITTPLLAYFLKVGQANPHGVLILGAQPWVQELALLLKNMNCNPLLVDTNDVHIRQARRKGLRAVSGNIFSEDFIDQMDFGSIGHFLGMLPNDETNALAGSYFSKIVGGENVYQLPYAKDDMDRKPFFYKPDTKFLFGETFTYEYLDHLFNRNGNLRVMEAPEGYDLNSFRKQYRNHATLLFIVDSHSKLKITETDQAPTVHEGDRLIYLAHHPDPITVSK